MPRRPQPARRSPSFSTSAAVKPKPRRRAAAKAQPSAELQERFDRILGASIDFIANPGFDTTDERANCLSPLVEAVEHGGETARDGESGGLPAHLRRMCATQLLSPDEERELFQRMNYCKFRAQKLRAALAKTRPTAKRVAEIEQYLSRALRLRNHLIQANTRLVMSIARRFADDRNPFDELLSQGLVSLMHAIEKFDFDRGYRFSTYATCAVRRDLCRAVMDRKKHSQRYSTGADELLTEFGGETPEEQELSEQAWKRLSEALRKMIHRLDERERLIVSTRFGLDGSGKRVSYSGLGKRMGISKERVRQLANRALEKLQEWAPEYRLESLLS